MLVKQFNLTLKTLEIDPFLFVSLLSCWQMLSH